MKSAKILLLKLFGLSLLLFLIWRPVSYLYGVLLRAFLLDRHGFDVAIVNGTWPYVASLFLIPLISLACVTPGLTFRRRSMAVVTGLLISLLLDVVKIRHGIGENGQYPMAYSVYHSLKWMMPLLVWVLVSHRQLAAFSRPEPPPNGEKYSCPLCGDWTEYPVEHISICHGTRSLRYKKVRKFLARNQPLAGSPL